MASPTIETYSELQEAFNHFNHSLFNNLLPACLITLQREKKTKGYFFPERFINLNKEKTDEIALNPTFFGIEEITKTMQTLVHEMCHLWQYHFGKPGRGRYHNKEWADKMEAIGLMPSSTGEEGGKKTGDRMMDYPIKDGEFLLSCSALLTEDFKISWFDRFPSTNILIALNNGDISEDDLENLDMNMEDVNAEKKKTRIKYHCSTCDINVWGKAELNIVCGECSNPFEQSE